jgi:hypothetical protein
METSSQTVTVERSGGCLCGAIRFRVTSDPRVHDCHCDMCRRATGSAFATLAWVPSATVSWLSKQPARRSSSPIAERGFCQACGSPLTLSYDAAQHQIALPVGTSDNPAGLEPRLPWVCCGIDLPHHDTEGQW